MTLHVVEAMNDSNLFAPFFDGDSWSVWKVLLKCLPLPEPLPLSADELEIFKQFTGRSKQPEVVRECYLVLGRGSGKTRIAATAATFIACFRDFSRHLAPGQLAVIPLQAGDKRQAREQINYVRGLIDSIPVLKRMVVAETKESVELSTRCVIEVRVSSFKKSRGFSSPISICDELAFWWSDADSANPDSEVIRSLRPALGRIPNSLLLGLSSPYARKGHLWEMYSKHFGCDDSNILIWCADTLSMNPTFDQSVIQDTCEQDESSALAEYGRDGKVEFRKDVESYVSREIVQQSVITGRFEVPLDTQFGYQAFVDPSGGSSDSFTLAIAHPEKDKAILDVCREVRPPFSPASVVQEFSELLKQYGINRVKGDKYSGEFVRELFRKNEITYEPSQLSKSEIYKDFLGILNSGKCELLDVQKMLNQLCALERRTGSGGKDVIDHAPKAHDDMINSAAGCIVECTKKRPFDVERFCNQAFGKRSGHPELPEGMF